jgi:hypothetical protein
MDAGGERSRFFRVRLSEIGYVRAILEGEEGLAQVLAPDPDRGEIEIVFPDARAAEVDEVVCRLTCETGWIEIDRPAAWSERA